jgi:hypothetical protein
MAVEFSEVDNNSVIAGGVTTANFPQAAKNFRLSSMRADSRSIGFDICLSSQDYRAEGRRKLNNIKSKILTEIGEGQVTI